MTNQSDMALTARVDTSCGYFIVVDFEYAIFRIEFLFWFRFNHTFIQRKEKRKRERKRKTMRNIFLVGVVVDTNIYKTQHAYAIRIIVTTPMFRFRSNKRNNNCYHQKTTHTQIAFNYFFFDSFLIGYQSC